MSRNYQGHPPICQSNNIKEVAGLIGSKVNSNKLPVIRRKQPIQLVDMQTTYKSQHGSDFGEIQRINSINNQYSKVYRQTYSPFQIPYQLKQDTTDVTIDYAVDRILDVGSSFNPSKSIQTPPNYLNPKLKFNKQTFRDLTQSQIFTNTSLDNLQWIKEFEAHCKKRQLQRGYYTPSVNQLDIYGRKVQPSKFQQAGLWIAMSNKINQYFQYK